jgi:hypothetical protein
MVDGKLEVDFTIQIKRLEAGSMIFTNFLILISILIAFFCQA